MKCVLLLEELKEAYGVQYTVTPLDPQQGENKKPWYTKLNPNGKWPVLIDHDNGDFAVPETQGRLLNGVKQCQTGILTHSFSN